VSCIICGSRIVGTPGHQALGRGPGNGFYRGTRAIAWCRDCWERQVEAEADSAFRSQIAHLATCWLALRSLGQTDEQIVSTMTPHHPASIVEAARKQLEGVAS
jgi:hypothetical protein